MTYKNRPITRTAWVLPVVTKMHQNETQLANWTPTFVQNIFSFHFRDKHFRASEPTNVYKSDSNQIVDGAILQSYMNLLFAVD